MFMKTFTLFLINLDIDIIEGIEKNSRSILLIPFLLGNRNSPRRRDGGRHFVLYQMAKTMSSA